MFYYHFFGLKFIKKLIIVNNYSYSDIFYELFNKEFTTLKKIFNFYKLESNDNITLKNKFVENFYDSVINHPLK